MMVDQAERAAALEVAGARPAIGLVSVIVPHLDDYDNLDACFTLLQAQNFLADRMEIIIADNRSSRGLYAVRRIVGERGRVIEVAERGAAAARRACEIRVVRRSRSSTATVGRASAGSRKASPNSGWRISSARGSTSWFGIHGE